MHTWVKVSERSIMATNKPKYFFSNAVQSGAYLAAYFERTTTILKKNKPNNIVTMQWFQREPQAILAGIEQVVALLEAVSPNFKGLKIWALTDGQTIKANEPVLKIEGHYQNFGFLEGMIDGILARNTSIATTAHELVKAAGKKPIIAMNDRADLYLNQPVDGYACYVGGIRRFVTEAATAYLPSRENVSVLGTMPHALIQSYNGDTLAATIAFHETFPKVPLVSLVDYNNDCVREALIVADYFGKKLWAVRLDTSSALTDKFLEANKHHYPPGAHLSGVSSYLVREVRKALDKNGHKHVKIIVSSGFNAHKIKDFEAKKVPVDIYGVGSALSKVKIEFTGDLVLLNGLPQAKIGRHDEKSTRLKRWN